MDLKPLEFKRGSVIGYKSIHSNENCITLAVVTDLLQEKVHAVDIEEYNLPHNEFKPSEHRLESLHVIVEVRHKFALRSLVHEQRDFDQQHQYLALFPDSTVYYPAKYVKHTAIQIHVKFSDSEEVLPLYRIISGFKIPTVIEAIRLVDTMPFRLLQLEQLQQTEVKHNTDAHDNENDENERKDCLTASDVVETLQDSDTKLTRRPIETADGLLQYTGPDWQYTDFIVELDCSRLLEKVFDLRHDEDGNLLMAWKDDPTYTRTDAARTLMRHIQRTPEFSERLPQMSLYICRTAEFKLQDPLWDLNVWYGCSFPGCQTQVKCYLKLGEVLDVNHTSCYVEQLNNEDGCIHAKHVQAGIIHRTERESFDLSARPSQVFNSSIIENADNPSQSYNNYFGTLRSKDQARKIKSRCRHEQILGTGYEAKTNAASEVVHREIAKLMILQQNYKQTDLNALDALGNNATAVDKHELGWIHELQPDVPSFSMYHRSVLKQLVKFSKKARVPLYLDDISNLTVEIGGARLLHSVLWIKDPSGGPPLQVAEFICSNWKASHFGNLLHALNTALEDNGPVDLPVFVMDNYAGFIKWVIRVRNGMTSNAYYNSCLSFCKGDTMTLPRTLVARCQGHTSHDICMHYNKRKAQNSKKLVKAVWNTLRKTTDFAHWLAVISLLHYVQNNEGRIALQAGSINIIDPFDNVDYNLEQMHQEALSQFKSGDFENVSLSAEERGAYLNEDDHDTNMENETTVRPVQDSNEIYVTVTPLSGTAIIGFGMSQVEIGCEHLVDENAILLDLEDMNVFKYPFDNHFKFLGSYSAKIFGTFTDTVTNNGTAEKGNAEKRVVTAEKNVVQRLFTYANKTIKHSTEQWDSLFGRSKSKLSQTVRKQTAQERLAIAAGFKTKPGRREPDAGEKAIHQRIETVVSKLSRKAGGIALTNGMICRSMCFWAESNERVIFSAGVSADTKVSHVATMRRGGAWCKSQQRQQAVLDWMDAVEQLSTQDEAVRFIFGSENDEMQNDSE